MLDPIKLIWRIGCPIIIGFTSRESLTNNVDRNVISSSLVSEVH